MGLFDQCEGYYSNVKEVRLQIIFQKLRHGKQIYKHLLYQTIRIQLYTTGEISHIDLSHIITKGSLPVNKRNSFYHFAHQSNHFTMSQVQQNGFTKGQQYFRVAYLGICFMIMFTSFNSLQNMVSKLYDDYGYKNLGQTAILFIYFSFSIATWVTSYIIKHVGYKKTMFWSSLGYAVFEGTGLLIVTKVQLNHTLVWIIINAGACLCGFAASALWVAQGAYTSKVASQKRKSQLFGLFWALMMSSQILGNLLGTFVLGRINNLVYFIILTILGSASAFMFIFLPEVKAKQETQQLSLKEEVRKVLAIIKDKKYKYINMYFFFPGLTVAFYAGFLYKLVKMSLIQEVYENDDTYNKRVNEYEGYVFITLGLSQILTGFWMNRFSEKFNTFKLATIGTLMVELAGFVSFVCYYLKSYPLCFLASFLWGASETFLQTNTGGLIAKVFPGKVEGFSVYRIFFSCGVVFVLTINIALSSYDPYIFLTIILVLQTLVSVVSLNLRYLEVPPNERGTNEESLLSKEENIESKELAE